ncbi:hypothetical protein AB0H88_48265 [Nonomuraea sp. NPDC050680]|uniref:hypothetical protein n=1 Tax=Nonomuraea sp. NPDC050680 TaxID=3154630 RepID=UPI0033FA220C
MTNARGWRACTGRCPSGMKAVDNRYLPPADSEGALLSAGAFGHAGMGGSLGYQQAHGGIWYAPRD